MRIFMAKIIEFYIPQRFQKKVRWVPELQLGRLIEFPSGVTRSNPDEHAAIGGREQLDHSKAVVLQIERAGNFNVSR